MLAHITVVTMTASSGHKHNPIVMSDSEDSEILVARPSKFSPAKPTRYVAIGGGEPILRKSARLKRAAFATDQITHEAHDDNRSPV
jgi:hypothetical protein